MCQDCWMSYGSPKIDDPLVRMTADAIRQVNDFESLGGCLHTAIADWNLEDEYFDSTSEYSFQSMIDRNTWDSCAESLDAQRRCLSLLKGCDIERRASALGLCMGYWSTTIAEDH